MKTNKLFLGAMLVASIAMVSCNKDKDEPKIIDPGTDPVEEEQTPETPSIAAPGAGKTTIAFYSEVCPRGAYLLGTATTWTENDDSFGFDAVADAENWYSITIDYSPDFGGKVVARPSDESVAMGWSYQWGKNYDPNDSNSTVEEGKDNTIIISGEGEFEYENGGQPKLIHVADNGVVYIWVKNWATSPIIEAKKLEKAWIKTDWDGGDDSTGWEWVEMTSKGNGVFEYEAVWGGKGCNINSVNEGDGQWYPTDQIEKIGDPAANDKVRFTFVSEKMAIGKLSIEVIEKGETPVNPDIPTTREQEQAITVTGIVPEGWEHCYLWAWKTIDGNDENIFESWPGQELTITDGKVTYTFDDAVQVISVIFSNGDGKQTKDIKYLTKDTEIVIADNLQ